MNRTFRPAAPGLAVFVLCALSLWAPGARSAEALHIGDTAPDWTLEDADGEPVNLYRVGKGKVSVILFWATWCPYCRALMPRLQALAERYRERGVKFFALNIWEDGDPAAYMREHGYTFRLLPGAEAAAAAYGVEGTPGLFVLDGRQQVIYRRIRGTSDDDAQANTALAVETALHNIGNDP